MKIDFQFDTEYGLFSDAISLPDDHTFTDDDIEAMKQERLANWITIITTPSEPVEETVVQE
jgi:hypothetical protein